jgi:hypothetical protein
MRIFKLSTILSIIPLVRPSLIQKKTLCKDCKFYIANSMECGKFGEVNMVTGKKNFERALNVRIDENKCGQEAKHFEENSFKFITVPYYLIIDYWAIFGLMGFYLLIISKITKM